MNCCFYMRFNDMSSILFSSSRKSTIFFFLSYKKDIENAVHHQELNVWKTMNMFSVSELKICFIGFKMKMYKFDALSEDCKRNIVSLKAENIENQCWHNLAIIFFIIIHF